MCTEKIWHNTQNGARIKGPLRDTSLDPKVLLVLSKQKKIIWVKLLEPPPAMREALRKDLKSDYWEPNLKLLDHVEEMPRCSVDFSELLLFLLIVSMFHGPWDKKKFKSTIRVEKWCYKNHTFLPHSELSGITYFWVPASDMLALTFMHSHLKIYFLEGRYLVLNVVF